MKQPRTLPEITQQVGLQAAMLANIRNRGAEGMTEVARRLRSLARELDALAKAEEQGTE